MVATKEFRVIGTRPIRHDGPDKVTGRAQYGTDFRLTGMLYGRVKRSPHAHAIIKRIDASRALALPGVKAVMTAADFPQPAAGGPGGPGGAQAARFQLENFMASKKALYVGHPVAAVAATDPHIAEDALALIDVEYEVLPAVFDVREAMAEGAPILHEDLRTRETSPLASGPPADKPTNIAAHIQYKLGDIEKGFAEADVIIEREFTTPMFHQGYIEAPNGTAAWSKDGHLTVWNSSQGPHNFRIQLAQMFGLPLSKVTVVPLEIGGGFGGKLFMHVEPLAAVLAKKTGKPVKMLMTREEIFAHGPTSGTYVRVKYGAKRDGTITAAQAYMAYEAGAFPGAPLSGGMNGVFASYKIPNVLIDGYDVVVNKPKSAAYRAPGTPAGTFAGESTLNELAQMLDMDPMDLRIKNAAKEGDDRPWGGKWGVIGNLQVMEAMRNHPHYTSELQGENRGRGVSMGYWSNAGGETSASASINNDGTVQLVLGAVDVAGTRASTAMQLAETLGIAAEDVWPRVVDTDSVGFTLLTGGSRTTFASGWAVYELGMEIRKRMVERAARIWECDVSEVTYGDDGVIRGPKDSEGKERSFTFKQLAAQLSRTGGGIDVSVSVSKQSVGPSFGGHIVDVEVDKETGKVKILRYTAFQDAGRAIHPSYVESQIQGGAVQGIGMALSEEYVFGRDGRMQNASFLDYRMPTALDIPMIDTVIIEVPNPGHPYGVRGVAEVCVVPPLAALQTAVAEATGIRFQSLPMSPRVVLEALLEKGK